jgi:hypothetical protein
MKKFITCLVALVMVLSLWLPAASAAPASISNLTASIDKDNKVVVAGMISTGAGSQVTARIIDPKGNLEYLNQTTSQADGRFEFSYTMKNKEEGAYQVVVGGSGVETPVSAGFHYPCDCNDGNTGDNSGDDTGDDMTEGPGAGDSNVPDNTGNIVAGGGSVGGSSVTESIPGAEGPASVSLTAMLDSGNATATAKLDEEQFNQLLNNSKTDADGVATIVVEIPKVDGAASYSLQLPAQALASGNGQQRIVIRTDLGILEVPNNMLPSGSVQNGQELALRIGTGDKSSLSADLQREFGDKPVIELQLFVDGQSANWDNPGAVATVHIPYTAPANEAAQYEHIVIKYIDNQGNETTVASGRYDPESRIVSFRTSHFSMYAVAYVIKTYADLDEYDWARKQIEALSAKGIVNGTSDMTFQPEARITRADYLLLLMRTLELTAKANDNFSDVAEDAYYYNAIGSAKALGITSGADGNKFLPNEAITRQDMMVLTSRALAAAHKLEPASANEAMLGQYSDYTQIADYAVMPVSALVGSGLIEGAGGQIMPLSATTRAEAAVLMYRIYHSEDGAFRQGGAQAAAQSETSSTTGTPSATEASSSSAPPSSEDTDAANLLDNGGFEAGNLNPWTITGSEAKFVIAQEEARTGKYALNISGPQNYSYISQTFEVVPGAEYTLSFYAKGSGNFVYRVKSSAAFAKADTSNSESEWKPYTLKFTAPSGFTQLSVALTDVEKGKFALVDDIVIRQVTGVPK